MNVTINSRKYDQSIRRSWRADLIESVGSMRVFVGEFGDDVEHADLGLIPCGTVSYEYYWLDRWYNVFRFLLPDGALRNYYCNVNMPPVFENGVLDYVDLDIDVVVWPDGTHKTLDLDEFEENAAVFNYPDGIRIGSLDGLAELIALKNSGKFPFDADIFAIKEAISRVT